MKTNQLSSILNQELGVHGNNCATVIDFTFALQRSRTVNLQQMVNYSSRIGEIAPASIYKNYQRLIHDCKISQSNLARCIIKMFELSDCKLTLALDRTNWKYGAADINLLVLSVCLLGCAIPLYWLELDTRGNSNSIERKELMNKFITEFGADQIDYLIADREFIGNDWFAYLNANAIKFVVRIKSNMLLQTKDELIHAGKLFKQVGRGGVISYHVEIDGVKLLAHGTRSTENDLVIVVSNDLSAANLLVIYAKRWRIECLFANLKSKGFNFEDTRFTIKERISNLTKLIILSLAICYLLGLVRASWKPISLKKHGYKQNSYFRYGYDLLIQKLNSSFADALKLVTTCLGNFKLENKCRKLISVM